MQVRKDERSDVRSSLGWAHVARILVALMIGAALGAAGYFAGTQDYLGRGYRRVVGAVERRWGETDQRDVERSIVETNFHRIDVARIPVGQAWALAEIDGFIVFSSRYGRFAYIDGDQVRSLGLSVDLGQEAVRRAGAAINPEHVRVTDLLIEPRGDGSFALYAAHVLFDGTCARMVVDEARVVSGQQELRADNDWQRIFSSQDCLPALANGLYSIGNQSGGRLVRLDAETLALSIGDFERPVRSDQSISDIDNSDFGKIIAISLTGGGTRVLARGMRNPQGLLMARDGTLWETEHGPRGGDELNIIRANRDYGWPHVTYGAPYPDPGWPNWPSGATPNSHAGYEAPVYAFVPSIGISNLTEADAREFPEWRDRLVVASLRDNALHLMRIASGRAVSIERIEFPGMRIRDIITLADGRLAFATDAGDLVVLSNADRSRTYPVAISGLDAIAEAPLAVQPSHEAQEGAWIFQHHCSSCHSLDGSPGIGPTLASIIGREVGSSPGFAYSQAMRARRETWSERRVARFLDDVDRTYPGTNMPQPERGINVEAIAHFLAARDQNNAAR